MALFSEPNSFYQLQNYIYLNCDGPVDFCLPVLDAFDIINFKLFTNDNPAPDINNRCEFPKTLYGYRMVKDCHLPVPSGTSLTYPAGVTQFQTNLVEDGVWAVNPPGFSEVDNKFVDGLACDECFYIQIIKTVTGCNEDFPEFGTPFTYTSTIAGCLGCFKKICDPCHTTLLEYYNNENAFGFYYKTTGNAALISNRIRLPFYLRQPLFPTTRNVFTLSNGSKKKLSARVEKEWSAITDYMPKEWHEKLAIALEHDSVSMVNVNANINSEVMMESNYDIDWQAFLDNPLAQASFKVKQIPYNNINTNCQ